MCVCEFVICCLVWFFVCEFYSGCSVCVVCVYMCLAVFCFFNVCGNFLCFLRCVCTYGYVYFLWCVCFRVRVLVYL